MEYDIQQVLVSPGDMILVLLIQRVQEILPGQPTRDHAILDGKTSTGNIINLHFLSYWAPL